VRVDVIPVLEPCRQQHDNGCGVRQNRQSSIIASKQDFVYLSDEDVYRCPAGEKIKYHCTNEEHGQNLRRYWTNICRDCALKPRCTGKERRITRWEHEHVLEAVQKRLDNNPQAMRLRRQKRETWIDWEGIQPNTKARERAAQCFSGNGPEFAP
jgi:hypothetical protein